MQNRENLKCIHKNQKIVRLTKFYESPKISILVNATENYLTAQLSPPRTRVDSKKFVEGTIKSTITPPLGYFFEYS